MRYKRKCTLIVIACFRDKRDCLSGGGFSAFSVYLCPTQVFCNRSRDFTSEQDVFVWELFVAVYKLFVTV